MKEILTDIAISLLLAAGLFWMLACGQNVRDGCHIEGNILSCPKAGTSIDLTQQTPDSGESCTVVDTETGAEIVCPDGSSVEIFDGEDGQVVVCHKNKNGERKCRVK